MTSGTRDAILASRGANTFDQVWRTSSGEYIIVEVKGGSATPSSSRIWRSGDARRYQQGTEGYMRSIIEDSLAEEGGRLDPAIARALNDARREGRLSYVEVSQPLGEGGALDAGRSRVYWRGAR
jgi:hypothetical protein